MNRKISLILALSVFGIGTLVPAVSPGMAARADEQTGAATGSAARRFDGKECYAIVPVNAGSSTIDASGSGAVHLWETHRGTNQQWKVTETDGYCCFTDSATGNVMTVNGAAAQGQGLTVSPYNGSDSQLWKLEDAGDDSYFIHSKLDPSLVLDNFGATAASGAAIVLYPKNNGSNQRFRFVPETTVKPRSEWGASRSDCSGSAWDYWDGSSDSSWYYADTAAYTYTLDSASQLAGAAQLVRDRVTDFCGKTIVLKKDLNLCGSEWQKIGTKDSPFRGSFNGGGHAIIGLTVTGSDQYTGFFGCADGGSICHFAIQGSVTGDTVVGGVCGWLRAGHISDIYSEITLPKATEDYQGGICGLAEYAGYIENCTQNARVNSYDRDSCRGGIAGYSRANIRGCVNRGAVECDWNNVGGITGFCEGGKIEYCANYGRVGGGDWAERVGGICGESSSDAVIFSCRNEGEVFSSGDDHIGGIVGWQTQNSRVLCCINLGTVHGDTYVGGIVGEGICACSLNAGHVSGDGKVGAVSGNTTLTNWCRALSGTAGSLNGKGGDCEAAWVSEEDLVSGKAAYELNCRSDTGGVLLNYAYGIHNTVAANVFYQNLGADPYPEFTGAAVVSSGGSVRNDMYAVSVEYDAELGTVTGGGSYQNGSVTLSAKPASGCVFDRYEVTQMNGTASETITYKDAQITLTDDIRRSYAVRAVFSVYDDTPAELRLSVRLELECTNDVSGWNSNVIPVLLVDSTGKQHAWNIPCSALNEPGRKAEHTFALGTASPTAVYAYPDFGGGVTFRDYGLKARMWINLAGEAMESEEVVIRSYPFVSSVHGDDYMHLTFGDYGTSRVGIIGDDGKITWKGNYTRCSDAWEAAQALGGRTCVQLQSAWLLDRALTVGKTSAFQASYRDVTVDLNGYPVIRTVKKISENGCCFTVNYNNTLTVTDSNPKSQTCSAFIGGSIQGGRNSSGGGLIHVEKDGTLRMTGGTLYNGGTDSSGGGAVQNHGTAELDGVLIASCWTSGANSDNDGGAIYTDGTLTLKNCMIRDCKSYDHAGAVMLGGGSAAFSNVAISGCKALDNEGGAIYISDEAALTYTGGSVRNCSANEDDGGAVYISISRETESYGAHSGNVVTCENVVFENNYTEDNGGAVYIDVPHFPVSLNQCSFLNNHADDDGGAVYVKRAGSIEGCVFRDSIMQRNSSGGSGGAVYMESYIINQGYNSNGALVAVCSNIILHNSTLTDNTAGSGENGGAVYLGGNTHLGLQGKMTVGHNTADGQADNIYVKSDAMIRNGGLYEGSEIHLTPAKTSNYKVMRISNAQSRFFQIDRGTENISGKTEVAERFVSSVIGDGNFYTILTGLLLMILSISVIAFVKHRSKKKQSAEPKNQSD